MHLHKSRLVIDYVHDDKEIIGYLNHFATDTGDLVASGALTPSKHMTPDRALEIMDKMDQGVPYEASINFGGDGIKVQEVMQDEVTEVNGFQFEGPGVIIREWPLRGVAICPYGADMNTESKTLSHSKQVFSASVISEPEATTKETAMSDPVDVEAQVETPEVELTEASPVEEAPVEEPTEDAPAPEADAVETPEPTEELTEPESEPEANTEFSVTEFNRITDEFGADVAAQTVKDGGDYSTALKLHCDALTTERDALKTENAELKASKSGGRAAGAGDADTAKGSLFKTGK
jgi:hypothetical protein